MNIGRMEEDRESLERKEFRGMETPGLILHPVARAAGKQGGWCAHTPAPQQGCCG